VKKLINKIEDYVRESLQGLAAAHGDLVAASPEPAFVYRVDAPVRGKVALVSGGGSGHEPLHGGFVGRGMLDAACPGEVFTSPTPDQMAAAARKVHGGAGVLFVVKNYSGDLMNFEMASEIVHGEGVPVASVVVDDDVAVRDSLYTQGRRGVGTTVLLEKICGAAAEEKVPLDRLLALGRRVASAGRSMGMALTACTVPAAGKPSFDLAEPEMEIGIGIHGEPGRERMAVRPADEIVEMLVGAILDDGRYERPVSEWEGGARVERRAVSEPPRKGDRVLLFVNGMGGTPLAELMLVYRKAAEILEKKGFAVSRRLVGNYITSLEMQGFSVTLLRLDDEMIRLWDAPVHTPALRWGV
jgi:phosphoenolpyruvate---glycerone phosphotransferase subunit DhaK